jgi:acetyl-CoA synthetase
MGYPTIRKPTLDRFRVKPNLINYDDAVAHVDWESAMKDLDGLPGGGINIAHEAIDRHAKGPLKDKVAMIWEGSDGTTLRYTFEDMRRESNRFANALQGLGIKKGDRVFVFLDRVPECYFAVFGTLKAGAVIGPLFSAFGPDAIKDRLEDSAAKVLITSHALKERVYEILKDLPELKHLILVDRGVEGKSALKSNEWSWNALTQAASEAFTIVPTTREDYSIIHYTSGTTGKPKGATHGHGAILGHYLTAKYILDLHPEDIYWCTADPGWVTGTSYGMFGPWANGVTNLIYEGRFSADDWYKMIEKYKVSVWYTAPTAIRMLMKAGDEIPKKYDLSSVRFAASVGEPLNPEAVVWGEKALGMAFHDNWWQTETGCMQIANYAIMDIRPGSMGRPHPGTKAGILTDRFEEITEPNQEGLLALRPGWPSMFKIYWNKKDLYDSRFKNGWYITGDKAWRDSDGYYWFVGRADDVINTAGHLVGPFEVESALIEHPAIAEAGVIGKPDPIRMEIVKAFVSLKEGYTATDALREEIKQFVRKRLAAHAYPREIDFVDSLPKTRSGKIMRRLLKAKELGLPLGDTSTLED